LIVQVQCYSGYKADERPVSFQLGAQRHIVEEVLDQWHSPDATFFKVRSDDGAIYVLRHGTSPQNDLWSLESFRQG